MTKFFFTLTLLSSLSFAGGQGGNGADAIVCYDKPLFEIYKETHSIDVEIKDHIERIRKSLEQRADYKSGKLTLSKIDVIPETDTFGNQTNTIQILSRINYTDKTEPKLKSAELLDLYERRVKKNRFQIQIFSDSKTEQEFMQRYSSLPEGSIEKDKMVEEAAFIVLEKFKAKDPTRYERLTKRLKSHRESFSPFYSVVERGSIPDAKDSDYNLKGHFDENCYEVPLAYQQPNSVIKPGDPKVLITSSIYYSPIFSLEDRVGTILHELYLEEDIIFNKAINSNRIRFFTHLSMTNFIAQKSNPDYLGFLIQNELSYPGDIYYVFGGDFKVKGESYLELVNDSEIDWNNKRQKLQAGSQIYFTNDTAFSLRAPKELVAKDFLIEAFFDDINPIVSAHKITTAEDYLLITNKESQTKDYVSMTLDLGIDTIHILKAKSASIRMKEQNGINYYQLNCSDECEIEIPTKDIKLKSPRLISVFFNSGEVRTIQSDATFSLIHKGVEKIKFTSQPYMHVFIKFLENTLIETSTLHSVSFYNSILDKTRVNNNVKTLYYIDEDYHLTSAHYSENAQVEHIQGKEKYAVTFPANKTIGCEKFRIESCLSEEMLSLDSEEERTQFEREQYLKEKRDYFTEKIKTVLYQASVLRTSDKRVYLTERNRRVEPFDITFHDNSVEVKSLVFQVPEKLKAINRAKYRYTFFTIIDDLTIDIDVELPQIPRNGVLKLYFDKERNLIKTEEVK